MLCWRFNKYRYILIYRAVKPGDMSISKANEKDKTDEEEADEKPSQGFGQRNRLGTLYRT